MAPLMNAYGNSCPSPYRLHIGVFFGSLHGTLNHLLLTDCLWLQRLTGEGDHPNRLDAILYEGRTELTRARIAEDNRLIAVIDKYDDTTLANLHSYKTTSGMPQSQVLSEVLRVHAQHNFKELCVVKRARLCVMCLMAAFVPHRPNQYFHVTASNGIVSPYTPTRDHGCISNRTGSSILKCPRCRCRLATFGALPTSSMIARAIIMLGTCFDDRDKLLNTKLKSICRGC
jgi:hypothetical protein